MGDVYLSCGHKDKYRTFGWPVRFRSEETTFEGTIPCIVSSNYCHTCYLYFVKEHPDLILFHDWEEEEFFEEYTSG